MDEEDEFGDLYADLGPEVPNDNGESLPGLGPEHDFEDDENEIFYSGTAHSQVKPAVILSKSLNTPNSFPLGRASQLGEQDFEEDEELLTSSQHDVDRVGGLVIDKNPIRRPEDKALVKFPPDPLESPHGTTGDGMEDRSEAFLGLDALDGVGEVVENGIVSSEAGSEEDITAAAPLKISNENSVSFLPGSSASFRNPEESPDVDDLTNHSAAIPGLSTKPIISGFLAEDEGDGLGEDWDRGESGGQHLTHEGIIAGKEEDWDSDSEDDLQIVLNDDHAMYPNYDRGVDKTYGNESEDDDEEDLVIVAGDEPAEDQEWGEEQPLPVDGVQAVPGDRVLPVGGEGQGGSVDERGQTGKGGLGVALNQGASRIGYSNHPYHSHHSQYKYVRPGATIVSGGATSTAGQVQSSRISAPKGGSGRGDWSGAGRGSYGSQRMPQGPSWGGGSRGFQYGFEFNLPPSKTVFDVDLDSFEERPWRLPGIDITEFFNYGFKEDTWKDYCKQLAKLRLEATMQSKIRVYESGRSEQDYDPDLPPELAAAAGVHEASGESMQRRQTEIGGITAVGAAGGSGRGAGRGHMQAMPTGRAIQVEGGSGERCPSVDVRRQRFRDSDAILLVFAIEDEPSKGQSFDEVTQVDEEEDGEVEEHEEIEENVKIGPGLEAKKQQDLMHETENPAERSESISKRSGLLPGKSVQGAGVMGPSTGFDADRATASSSDPGIQPAINPGSSMLSSGSLGPVSNHKMSRQSNSPARILVQEERETEEHSQSSSTHQDSQCVQEGRKYADSNLRKSSDSAERIPTLERLHSRDHNSGVKDTSVDNQSAGHGEDNQARSCSREDDALNELKRDPNHSAKRDSLSSHDESYAVLKDGFNLLKPAREDTLDKDSEYSRVHTKGIDEEEESQFRQHRGHLSMSMEDKHAHHDEEIESQLRKETFLHARQELKREALSQTKKVDEQRRAREENVEKPRVKEQATDWHEREDGVHMRRKEREDGIRKDHFGKGVKQKERGQIGDWPHLRRKRDEERREDRLEKGPGHREREERPMSWRDVEVESHSRRKKEEDFRRRDRPLKEEGSREQRERDKKGAERRDHEPDVHLRRREEESRRRDRVEDYRQPKSRDLSRKEWEDTYRQKGAYQDMHGRREKDEERIGQVGSRRHSEDRSWLNHSRDENYAREHIRSSSNDRDHTRDKRKREQELGKDRERLDDRSEREGRARTYHERESIHIQEEQMAKEEKNLRHDHLHRKHNPLVDDLRTSEDHQSSQSDRRKSDAVRNKDSDRNGLGSFLADERNAHNYSDGSKKRKAEDHHIDSQSGKVSRRSSEDLYLKGRRASVPHQGSAIELVRKIQGPVAQDMSPEESPEVLETASSEDAEFKNRGRSKLERWTSRKGMDDDTSYKHPMQDENSSKADRHRGSHRSIPSRYHDIVSGSRRDSSSRRKDGSCLEENKSVDLDRKLRKEMQSQRNDANWDSVQDEKIENHGKNSIVDNVDGQQAEDDPQFFQQSLKKPPLDMAAKLEKRKERFKLQMIEDRELSRRLESESNQQVDRAEVKQERPARKRRWGSG